IASRAGIVKRISLSPETDSAPDMLTLSRRLVDAGVRHLHLFLHSPSLSPGLSPFATDRTGVERMYRSIATYVEGLARVTALRFVTVSEAATLLAAAAASPALHRAHQNVGASHTSATNAGRATCGKTQRHTLWLARIQEKNPWRKGFKRARLKCSVCQPRTIVRTLRRYSLRSDGTRGTVQTALSTDTARNPCSRASSAAAKSRLMSSGSTRKWMGARTAWKHPAAPGIPATRVSSRRTHMS